MHEFGVWAPLPRRVDVMLNGRRLPMRRAAGGWWTRRADPAGPGSEYAFSLDGGPLRADPRSAFQPGRRLAEWVRSQRRAALDGVLQTMSPAGREALARALSELADPGSALG